MKRIIALSLSLLLIVGLFAGCKKEGGTSGTGSETGKDTGRVYYLNFKPEIADAYKKVISKYKEETGKEIKVETAAGGTYEEKLKAEITKKDSPTIFQINGPRGHKTWADYCADLSGSKLYEHLNGKDLAIKSGNAVYGIPNAVEGYGIIYNNAIMKKYFAMDGAKAKSMDDITGFAKLEEVVKDMTAKKDALEIKGVFAATSFAQGEDWRWQTHLLNVPVHYEFKKNNVDLGSDGVLASEGLINLKFEYSDNYKNIFDLYLNNSIIKPTEVGKYNVDQSMTQFALGQVAMVQNGTWGWSQIASKDGLKVKEEDIKILPIYTGVDGEDKQGICVGTENYLAVNAKASKEDQKASIEFLEWLYTSDAGKKLVYEDLLFLAPFDTFKENEVPTDPLIKSMREYMDKDLYIPWDFTVFPSQTFKDNFGGSLREYSQGNKQWADVKKDMVADWKKEAELVK